MLPWTRGLRKEFLPLFSPSNGGPPVLKPVAHHVLETMVGAGATDITLVVGAKDLAFVQNYFTVDQEFLERHAHHRERLRETERFYGTLRNLRLRFAVQPTPRGFGDAVLQAEPFIGHQSFLLHAADAVVLEPRRGAIMRRMAARREADDLDAVLLVRKVENPSRYGVVEGKAIARYQGMPRLSVSGMEEKPQRPRSHWAATAAYAFSPRMFEALRAVARSKHQSELEVTDAIRWMLEKGGRVEALILQPAIGEWWSVGSPEGYMRALKRTQQKTHWTPRPSGRRSRSSHKTKH